MPIRIFRFVFFGLVIFSCRHQDSYQENVKLRIDAGQLFSSVQLSSYSEFDCFAINVVGSGISSQDPTLSPSDLLSDLISGSSACTYPGQVSIFPVDDDSPGTPIILNTRVPVGDNRVFQILGLIAEEGNSLDCNRLDSSSLGTEGEGGQVEVYLLGQTVANVSANQSSLQTVRLLAEFGDGIFDRADCGDTSDPIAPTASSLIGVWKAGACTTTPINNFGISSIVSQEITLTFSQPSEALLLDVTVDNYSDSTCTTAHSSVSYSYYDVSIGNFLKRDSSDRSIYGISYFVSAINLTSTTGSGADSEWQGLCNSPLSFGDLSTECSSVFASTSSQRFDVFNLSSAADQLRVGTRLFDGVASESLQQDLEVDENLFVKQ